jgi:hypothetical protein
MTIEKENEDTLVQDEEVAPIQERKSPAITVVVQSWATPIAGLVMLIAGLFGGYYGRPLISPDTSPAIVEEVEESVSVESGNAPEIAPTPDEDLATKQRELMATLVENTRHFRGDPNAPVTIIEFSDFQ